MPVIRAGRRKWCDACRPTALADAKKAKRAEEGTVSIGTPLICKNCGADFIKSQRRQFYCPPCSELSATESLPAYRKRLNEYQKKRNKRRRQEIPAVAIHARMSAGIRNSLKDGKKGRSWESLVGYSVEELMRHIERQFLKGMSWERRSEWHIDHVVPLVYFTFETSDDPGFHAAWRLSNLRPLWSVDNIKKSGHRTHLL